MATLYAPEQWEDPRFNTAEDDAKAQITTEFVQSMDVEGLAECLTDKGQIEINRLVLQAIQAETKDIAYVATRSMLSVIRVLASKVVDKEWNKDKCAEFMGRDDYDR